MLLTFLKSWRFLEENLTPNTGPVRVLRAYDHDEEVRIEAVGVVDSQYYDRTISAKQFSAQVKEVVGGTLSFDAEPRLFRLAVEALRTHLAHAFVRRVGVPGRPASPPAGCCLQAHTGKTIMAGLLMGGIMQRGEVSRVLVQPTLGTSPPSLSPVAQVTVSA